MKAGTPQHRELFCRTFIDTHRAYEPEALAWPQLDEVELARLRAFPFWSYARSIEQRAGRMVTAFAQTIDDPLIRQTVALQAVEETRHGVLMSYVVERYGIDAPPLAVPDAPLDPEEFRIFGFGECTDAFIGFGAFAIVRRNALFPEPLLRIFENLLWEEARHIVFFINWWRYQQAQAGRDDVFRRTWDAAGYHVRAALGTAKSASDAVVMPSVELGDLGGLLEGVTPATFLATALAEHRRMMSRFDRRLAKPKLLPTVATALLLAIRLLPPRQPAPALVPRQPAGAREAA